MTLARAIPILLISRGQLVKTTRFSDPVYLGDPRNAVKIFNDRGADELVVVDIEATTRGEGPAFELIEEIVAEAFMPVTYGGGIRSVQDARTAIGLGVEKVLLGTAAFEVADLVERVSETVGSSSTVVCVDYGRSWLGRERVGVRRGSQWVATDVLAACRAFEQRGAGELVIQCIDRDGTMSGYDVATITRVASAIGVPVIAAGGASSVDDLGRAVAAGAAAAAAGSMFVFHGPHRAVLINYPDADLLDRALRREW